MIQASVTFILFDDTCEQALAYYADVFNAEIVEKMTFKDMGYIEDDQRSRCIANATFKLVNQFFYAGDVVERNDFQPITSNGRISFWLELESYEEITTLESQLIKTGSTSLVGLHKTFWESHYAKLQDKFCVIWELNAQ